MGNFTILDFGGVSVIVSITCECNAEGREEGLVRAYANDEITGRPMIVEHAYYVGQPQKYEIVAGAVRAVSDYITA